MNAGSFERAAAVIAALLLVGAGASLWRGSTGAPQPHVREQRVAWRCSVAGTAAGTARAPNEDTGTCVAVSEVERCTTCHEASAHTRRDLLIARHAGIGCVACHGGDGLATEAHAAHDGLARIGKRGEPPEIEARCAACHEDTRARAEAPARSAWARWLAVRAGQPAPAAPAAGTPLDLAPTLSSGRAAFRAMRCGACHAVRVPAASSALTPERDASPIATPLALLALRSSPTELVAALRDHERRARVNLALDEVGATAVATHLAAIEPGDASTAIVHRASATGASAEEGKTLEDELACAACHDVASTDETRLRVDLGAVATTRSADWIAYFLADPARANPAATMPSLRLSAREAASLALHLVTHADVSAPASRTESVACKLPSGETKSLGRDACGDAIVTAAKCATCHATSLAPTGPSLARFGDSHDAASAMAKLVDHAGFHFDAGEKLELATYLLAQRDVRVRPDLVAPSHAGERVFAARGCAGCHALDDATRTAPGPSLFGEGLRVQPQWLFDFLREPERHAVRPRLHPEWVFRDLVPPDRVEPRMPSFALDERETTALVAFFTARDGASFPYAAAPEVALGGDALASAIGDLERKDRGACTSCHTVAQPDVARLREEGAKLAPALMLAHERLRPAWIEACIAQPEVWVAGMTPFAGSFDAIDRVRDLVLLLRERTVLPPAGQEAIVPALGLGDLPYRPN